MFHRIAGLAGFLSRYHQYISVPHLDDIQDNQVDEDGKQEGPSARNVQKFARSCAIPYWTISLIFIASLVISGLFGHYIGSRPNTDLLAPMGPIDEVFYYDTHFAQRPSDPEAQKSWATVFPKGRGFIYNPDVASEMMGLSVFHQLHCLDAIRRSYYAALDRTPDKSNHTQPGHARHCIDYLRQSLLCHADSNLEPIDPQLDGVTGWGSPRKCRDMDGLLAWANKYRTHDQEDHT